MCVLRAWGWSRFKTHLLASCLFFFLCHGRSCARLACLPACRNGGPSKTLCTSATHTHTHTHAELRASPFVFLSHPLSAWLIQTPADAAALPLSESGAMPHRHRCLGWTSACVLEMSQIEPAITAHDSHTHTHAHTERARKRLVFFRNKKCECSMCCATSLLFYFLRYTLACSGRKKKN